MSTQQHTTTGPNRRRVRFTCAIAAATVGIALLVVGQVPAEAGDSGLQTTTTSTPGGLLNEAAATATEIRAENSAFMDQLTGAAGSAQTITPGGTKPLELTVTGTCEPGGPCQLDVRIVNGSRDRIRIDDPGVTVSATCDGQSRRPIDLDFSPDLVDPGTTAGVIEEAPQDWTGLCQLDAQLTTLTP